MRKVYYFFIIFCLAGLSFLSHIPALVAQEDSELRKFFIEANFAYKDGHYEEAIEKYEKILQEGFENGNLYYNLANSYFKKGNLGKAALFYERARLFIPGDSDLKSNDDYVRSLLNLGRPEMPGNAFQKAMDRLFFGLSINSLTLLLSFLYMTAMVLLSLNLFFKKWRRFSRPVLILLVLLFFLASLSLSRRIHYLHTGAVVCAPEAEVHFEPSETATTFFKLSEGTLVEILEKSGKWYKIKRMDGKLGWVDSATLETIKSERPHG